MRRFVVLIFALLLATAHLVAQISESIQVRAKKTPLDQVLYELKESYGFQFAFDSDLLSKYEVTVNKNFSSQQEALNHLIRNLPLVIEQSGDVFLILPHREKKVQSSEIHISGQVLESLTSEPLPYSYILINRRLVQSDQQGHFNYLASADTSYNLKISHLGYFVYDTIVSQSLHQKFFLIPQMERIEEVQVISNPIEKSTLIGDRAGRMKINHQIAPILPGHGDNSVFNLLRLMPGIMASGESSNDLLIWGAYESHSKIQFDGYTVFGLKNFNDNIAVVNPFMVKNIEVMKGGYEARYGERVGGIVDIQGKDGTLQKPTATFNINSTTVNGMLQIPLSKKSSIIGAYRQTYYQLYDPTNITLYIRQKNSSNGNSNQETQSLDFDVMPDFLFRDANLKYSFKSDNGARFALSLYGGGDEFAYNMEGQLAKNILRRGEEEQNDQLGGSMRFNYPWKSGNATNITLAYSAFERQLQEQNETENERTGVVRITRQVESENTVNEMSVTAEHMLSLKEGHRLLIGAGAINNRVKLARIWNTEQLIDIDGQSPRIFAYLQDELPLGNSFELKTGVRTNYSTQQEKWYFEPRVSFTVKPIDGVKINASWGLYKQFLSKTTLVDSAYNRSQFWINSDGGSIPVLHAEHLVGGISFNKKGLTLSAEAFYKTTDGLNSYFNGNNKIDRGFYEGKAKTQGLDIFVKKEYKRHMAWISYTLSDTQESFPFYIRDEWQPAPHQQKHELKFAGVFNYKRFYLSANYVYGSGFERFDFDEEDDTQLDRPYKRLDASLVYRFKPGKIKAEAGISILNVLDTENIKYSNIRVSNIDEINLVGTYADAVSFTPALFLKIEL